MAARGPGGAAAGAGGKVARVPRPMYEPISTSEPTEADLELDAKLEAFMNDNVPVMTKSDLRRREQVLGKIRRIFLQVCTYVCISTSMSKYTFHVMCAVCRVQLRCLLLIVSYPRLLFVVLYPCSHIRPFAPLVVSRQAVYAICKMLVWHPTALERLVYRTFFFSGYCWNACEHSSFGRKRRFVRRSVPSRDAFHFLLLSRGGPRR